MSWEFRLVRIFFPAVLLGSVCAQGRADESLLKTLRLAHNAALDSIHTFSCAILVEGGKDSFKEVVHGKYWRSGNTIRAHEVYPDGFVEEVLIQDSELKSIGTTLNVESGRASHAASRKAGSSAVFMCDVWEYMLCKVPTPQGRKPLNDLLHVCSDSVEVEKLKEKGRHFIKLSCKFLDELGNPADLELWFDPSVNYLVRKMSLRYGQSAPRNRLICEVLAFSEAEPGIYFPEKCSIHLYEGQTLLSNSLVTLSKIEVNQAIPGNVFNLEIPKGTTLYDAISGTQYAVDRGGRQIGRARNLNQIHLLAASEKRASAFSKQTADERHTVGYWIALGSVLLLVLAGAAWVYRRFRVAR